MKTPVSRREFLQAAVSTAGALSLGGCTALDRVFMGQGSDNSDRVVILGAGFAGLMAAYELRLRGLPYRLFEGSSRVGGRAWTLDQLTPSGQIGEIGCEWFSQEQGVFFDLAKQLKLEIVEVPQQRKNLFWENGAGLQAIGTPELKRLREKAQGELSARKAASVEEWARAVSSDSAWLDWVRGWAVFHYGVSPDRIRSSTFMRAFLSASDVTDPWAGARYKFRAGSSALAFALLDRVMGVLPGDRLIMEHRLTRVERWNEGFELHFETPEGRKRHRAHQVICALPWETLKTVEGFDHFAAASAIANPVTARQEKAVLVFQERFWRKKWDQGRVFAKDPVWESSFRAREGLENPRGILATLWSGEKIFNQERWPQAHEIYHSSWGASSWSRGRGSYPGLERTEKIFEKPEGSWIWAGEHAAGEAMGTAAGALESGRTAALSIKKVDSPGLFR